MLDPVSKQALKDELVARLSDDLRTLERLQKATAADATHAEAKPENMKDTRALEQTYLARGQAGRVEELRHGVAALRAMPLQPPGTATTVAVGTLVTLEEDDRTRLLFIVSYGGGQTLAGGAVQVVTPSSPLGAALVGKRCGDVCDITLGGRARELCIVEVA